MRATTEQPSVAIKDAAFEYANAAQAFEIAWTISYEAHEAYAMSLRLNGEMSDSMRKWHKDNIAKRDTELAEARYRMKVLFTALEGDEKDLTTEIINAQR